MQAQRILVPLDGSELSEHVFPWLRLWVKHVPRCEIELLRCFELPATIYLIPELAVPTAALFSTSELGDAMAAYLKEKVTQLDLENVVTTTAMADPASHILELGATASLIVMASHGRGGLGRWLMGSVSTKVTRGATVPVLVISAKCLSHPPDVMPKMTTIVLAYDGSPAAQRAATKSAELARLFDATLHLYQGLSLVDMPSAVVQEANHLEFERTRDEMIALADSLEKIKTQVEIREVSTASGIVEYAEEIDANLIVMGSHGKGGLARWMIGSETERVLHHAHCPVLITH